MGVATWRLKPLPGWLLPGQGACKSSQVSESQGHFLLLSTPVWTMIDLRILVPLQPAAHLELPEAESSLLRLPSHSVGGAWTPSLFRNIKQNIPATLLLMASSPVPSWWPSNAAQEQAQILLTGELIEVVIELIFVHAVLEIVRIHVVFIVLLLHVSSGELFLLLIVLVDHHGISIVMHVDLLLNDDLSVVQLVLVVLHFVLVVIIIVAVMIVGCIILAVIVLPSLTRDLFLLLVLKIIHIHGVKVALAVLHYNLILLLNLLKVLLLGEGALAVSVIVIVVRLSIHEGILRRLQVPLGSTPGLVRVRLAWNCLSLCFL